MWTIFLNIKNDIIIGLSAVCLCLFVWGFFNYSRIEPLKAEIKGQRTEISKLQEDKKALQGQIDEAVKVISSIRGNDKRLSDLVKKAQETQSMINNIKIPLPKGDGVNGIKPASNKEIVGVFNSTIRNFNDRVRNAANSTVRTK